MYADEFWWQAMGEAARQQFAGGCVQLLGEEVDLGQNGTRRLFDVGGCALPAGSP